MSWTYEYILCWSIVTYIGTCNEYMSICILCWSSHLQYSTCKWCNHGMSRGQYTYVYVVKLLDRRQNLHLGRTDGARATEIDFWYGFLWCTHTGPNEWEMIRERDSVTWPGEAATTLSNIIEIQYAFRPPGSTSGLLLLPIGLGMVCPLQSWAHATTVATIRSVLTPQHSCLSHYRLIWGKNSFTLTPRGELFVVF